jgi:hypothetical protein
VRGGRQGGGGKGERGPWGFLSLSRWSGFGFDKSLGEMRVALAPTGCVWSSAGCRQDTPAPSQQFPAATSVEPSPGVGAGAYAGVSTGMDGTAPVSPLHRNDTDATIPTTDAVILVG